MEKPEIYIMKQYQKQNKESSQMNTHDGGCLFCILNPVYLSTEEMKSKIIQN